MKWLWLIFAVLVITALLAFLVSKGDGGFNKLELSVSGQTGGHDWVDLGLSVKWATCNVGASSINEPGYHLAWGESSPKSEYSWKTYRFRTQGYSDDDIEFSKYNRNSNRGSVDSKEVLELNDDAARVNWGEGWRTPTIEEMNELYNKCTWTWTKVRGKNGYLITSKTNGNCIFLPVTGMRWDNKLGGTRDSGYYWSSSLSPFSGGQLSFMTESRFAEKMHFYKKTIFYDGWSQRYDGFCIRPVID